MPSQDISAFRVDIRPTATSGFCEYVGRVQDLTFTGCSIRSPYQPKPGASLELRLYLPSSEWPLAVHHAEVTWSHWDCFTVEFRDGQASSLLATYLEHWESEPA